MVNDDLWDKMEVRLKVATISAKYWAKRCDAMRQAVSEVCEPKIAAKIFEKVRQQFAELKEKDLL